MSHQTKASLEATCDVRTEHQYVMRSAILVYGEQDRWSSRMVRGHLTIHPVELNAKTGAPRILAGRSMTESDYTELVRGLANQADHAPAWVDPSTLVTSTTRNAVWYPPAKRAMHFKESSFVKDTFTASAVLACPGLVFMVDRGRDYVFAVKGDKRPVPEDDLYQAPFFNVWARGEICRGTSVLAEGADRNDPRAAHDRFFGSHFSHPNFPEKDRLIKGVDPIAYWKRQCAKPSKAFDDRRLVPLGLKLRDLLDLNLLARLSGHRAQGEF